ncbi:MAG: hypothetical protein U1D41_16940 [Nitrosomonas sp.]|uniref:hypothetical protein n=1 Tax=Nitrosomonas sp. TaxID=42353 RepID=UPI00272F18DD|nr:hypothetical protein [Nitrosomonas sp.]MDP1550557.1 hypothetical protein [Nitrosomonas sp.]MDP3282563.1 hypothetical protein [Nitrosomonas sp.]MDP3608672.1 hypothetical protein [Methylophilus sp.]MDZ4107798.1 hypothetical protein [Nitrosomonas sp.]
MKINKNIFYTAVKFIFILFGIVPMIGLMLFGDLPSFSVLQSKVNWVEADLFLESGIFSDLSCNWQYV